MLVGSDKFGQNCGHWYWVRHDRVNAQICRRKKRRAAVVAKYVWL